ncbi:MAG: dimethyl sulfoxide reductase anchor subunit [Candidatus Aminicenantes bacterium]|nr:dimethyl sulfoxide reductase anchor subunit [Candidatus Aminicenantes bacterium]
MLKEWPLVAFTVAGQMAAGIFFLVNIPMLLTRGTPYAARTEWWLISLALAGGLMVLAALLSFFHLHHPLRARRVLSNMRTSWLSREIFFELGFIALVVLAVFLALRAPARSGFLTGVLIAASIAGILFLVSMSKLYMLPSVPIWNQAYTPLSFTLTALNLGAMTTAFVTRFRSIPRDYSTIFLFLSFFCVGVEILIALFIAPRHGLYGFRPGPSLRPPDKTPRLLHLGRLTFLAAGLLLLGAALIPKGDWTSAAPGPNGLLVMAFVLVLAGEVAGRFLFYGLLARPGR